MDTNNDITNKNKVCIMCDCDTENERLCEDCQELADNISEEALQAYKDAGLAYENDFSDFEESYQGKYSSDEDFTQELLENCGDMPKDLPAYIHIDWEGTARDIMMDYTEQDGYYFRNF